LILSEIKDSILDSVIKRAQNGDEKSIKILLDYCDRQLEENPSQALSYEKEVDTALFKEALEAEDPTDPENRK